MSKTKKIFCRSSSAALRHLLGAAVVASMPLAAHATENGNTEYPVGVDTIYVATRPPPGTLAIWDYNEIYQAGIYSGTKNLDGSHIAAYVTAFRMVYTWPTTFDDGHLTISSDAVLGIGNVNGKVPTPGGIISNGSTGMTDPSIWPFELTYHGSNFFGTTGLTVFLPWGTYNKDASPVKGLGQNHYAFLIPFYLTVFASKKIQIDAAEVTEFDTINPHTQYTNGISTTLSGGLTYNITPHIGFGPVAYYFQQLTNDTQSGVYIPKGNKGQALGLGIQAVYNIAPGTGVVAKYIHESFVQNRPGGNQIWVQFAVPF